MIIMYTKLLNELKKKKKTVYLMSSQTNLQM